MMQKLIDKEKERQQRQIEKKFCANCRYYVENQNILIPARAICMAPMEQSHVTGKYKHQWHCPANENFDCEYYEPK